jgi:hypothetical protein
MPRGCGIRSALAPSARSQSSLARFLRVNLRRAERTSFRSTPGTAGRLAQYQGPKEGPLSAHRSAWRGAMTGTRGDAAREEVLPGASPLLPVEGRPNDLGAVFLFTPIFRAQSFSHHAQALADAHPTPRMIVLMAAIERTAPRDSTAPSPRPLEPLPPHWVSCGRWDANSSERLRTAPDSRLGETSQVLRTAPDGSGRLPTTARQRSGR